MKTERTRSLGLLALLVACAATHAAVVFTDNFDLEKYPAGGTPEEFLANGWTTIADPTSMGVSISGNGGGTTETVLWGNLNAFEYNHMAAPINCGDLLTIDVNCTRFEGYRYLREIILWDGADPASRETVAMLDAIGHALGPYATWWTPPGKDRIDSLSYTATGADSGKYVIFKYGHSSGWGETSDITFSITPVPAPTFTVQPPASVARTEGESASLTASAIGCDVTYQWKKDGAILNGQTDTTLALTGLTTGDSGSYTVTATSGANSTESTACILTVEPKLGGGASLSIGVNFSANWSGYAFDPPVTATAYGVSASRWNTTPPTAAGTEMYDFGLGQFTVNWISGGTYSLFFLDSDLTPGNEQVNDSYLDDGGSGYNVQVSGLSSGLGFKEYVVKTIAVSDNATAFNTVALTDDYTATSQSLTYGPLTTAVQGYGRAAVSSSSTVMTSDSITLTSAPRDGTTRGCLAGFIVTDKPVITTQPVAPTGTIFNGDSFTLSAEVFGVPDLTYKWQKNGSDIPGATTLTYNKTGATTADSGVYNLIVSNAYGTATSVSVTVTVVAYFQPVILQDPSARAVYAGGKARFTVTADGGELSYQWKKGDADISGATSNSLTLSSVTALDEADYRCVVTNPAGTVNSAAVHLTVLAVPTSGYLGAVLADGPLSLWRLDEATGTMLFDSLGGRDGAYVGSIGLGQVGFMADDASVNFPNSGWNLVTPSTYGDVPYDAALNPAGPFSVELWVKPNGIPGDLFSPLSSMNVDAGRPGYLFYMNGGSGWQFRLGNAAGYIATVSGGTSSADWTHLVGVYDGSSAYLYVNGVEYGPVAASGFLPSTTVPLRIGSPTGFSRPWNGLVDEVAFYNHALNLTQVRNHLFAGTPLRVAMAPAAAIVANERPTFPVHGQNYGATWAATDNDGATTHTGVMKFDANSGNQIVVNGYPQLDSTTGTICFWVRVSEFPGTGSESAMVLDRRDTGGGGSGTIIAINDGLYATAGTIFFQANPSQANPFSSATTVNDGKWHHVTVTYSQAVGESVSIYIDGAYDATGYNASAWYWPAGMSVLLGKSRDDYWKKLHGGLDDVRFYNRILDDLEIGQVMSGAIVDPAALTLRLNFDSAPADGYRLTTTSAAAVLQSSDRVDSGYATIGSSPVLYIADGPVQFFRAVVP